MKRKHLSTSDFGILILKSLATEGMENKEKRFLKTKFFFFSLCSLCVLCGYYSAIANLQSVAYHLTTPEAQVKPAPKTEKRIKSPLSALPLLTASSRAIGTEAEDVFPYLSTLMKTFSGGISRRFLTASIILKFAW